jgi:hypothetical protein
LASNISPNCSMPFFPFTTSPLNGKLHIILTLKPGKLPQALPSYLPISLLSIVSKVLEKLLTRLISLVEHNGLIHSCQFGFRRRHSTIEQTHRIIDRLNEAFEHKAYCSTPSLISPKPSRKSGISAFYAS